MSKTQAGFTTTLEGEDDTLFFILCGGAGLLFIAIVVLCYKCRNKGKIQHTTTGGMDMNVHNNTGDMQLEDIDDEQNSSNRPSLSK